MADSPLSGEFLDTALLDTLVPLVSSPDITEALASSPQHESGSATSLLPSIEQRSLLFFDELAAVYIVLRVSNTSEDSLRTYISRLTIRLDAFAISCSDAEIQEGLSTTDIATRARDLVFSKEVQETDDPLIIVHDSDAEVEVGSENRAPYVFVLWKVDAFLNRPRTRLQSPSITFVASVALQPSQESYLSTSRDDYLPSLRPASANLLEPLRADPALKDADLFLPASRLTRVLPRTKLEPSTIEIKHNTPRAIRVIAAVCARVRYFRLNTYCSKPTTIASLDFEVTPFVDYDVVLEEADLTLSEGLVVPLTEAGGLRPPIVCRPKDDVTFLYKLYPANGAESTVATTALAGILDISLGAKVLVSEVCHPSISMRWRTTVDFSTPLNPVYGGPSQGLQRNNRPPSLPVSSSAAQSSSGVSTPVNKPPAHDRAISTSSTELGVTISFSGPSSVTVGKLFRWGILIVNHSTKSRKFAIVAIAPRKRTEQRRHATKPSTSSFDGRKDRNMAEAVADENIVYAMQKSAISNDTDLVSMSTDVRVGPLVPGSCHETEIKLLPLAAGPLRLDAIRIVDLNTNESTDIRDLPDIVAYLGSQEEG